MTQALELRGRRAGSDTAHARRHAAQNHARQQRGGRSEEDYAAAAVPLPAATASVCVIAGPLVTLSLLAIQRWVSSLQFHLPVTLQKEEFQNRWYGLMC